MEASSIHSDNYECILKQGIRQLEVADIFESRFRHVGVGTKLDVGMFLG